MFVGIGIGIARRRFAGGFAGSYSSRVIADGGTIEALTCVAAASSFLQSASLLIIPSGYKAGVAYAELPANGNGDLTWTRGGDAFRTNASGVIQRVPWNLLQYSEDFSNVYWAKDAGVTVDSNVNVAPNGTTTADRLNLSINGAVYRSGLSFGTGSFTLSVWLKGEGANIGKQVLLEFTNGNSTVTLTGDWQRFTTTGTNIVAVAIKRAISGQATSVLAWGIQVVEGTTAQTYLPTTDRLNFPRLDYTYGSCPALLLEPQRTNSLRNSTMQGASTSPSTLPTNWIATAGLTITIVGVGTENGLPYIDIQFSGTASATNSIIRFETNTQIVASNGQTWASSFWIKEIAAPNPPNFYQNVIQERNSSGTSLNTSTQTITISSTLTRNIFTRTNTNASTARITNGVGGELTIGNTYDFTVRIASPQLELGAYATTWINTTNAAATRLADTFTRNNIYTNGLISASGGTWYVELRNNVAYTRDGVSTGLFIDTDSSSYTNGINIRNVGGGSTRLVISKWVGGVGSPLFTTTTDTVKIAAKWNGTSADVFVNGVKQVSATSFTPTAMQFVKSEGNQVPYFIQAMALYPTPISDADCEVLTGTSYSSYSAMATALGYTIL